MAAAGAPGARHRCSQAGDDHDPVLRHSGQGPRLPRASYPRGTLTWVHDAMWTRKKVPLDKVQMERRPGGARDNDKVASMAKAVKAGSRMDPIVLVGNSSTEKYRIADGYHRALAHRHAGRATIDAYVASPATEHGPWETEMHAKKPEIFSRAMELSRPGPSEPRATCNARTRVRAARPPDAAPRSRPRRAARGIHSNPWRALHGSGSAEDEHVPADRTPRWAPTPSRVRT